MTNLQTTHPPHELWKYVLGDLEISESEATFNTWFKDTYIVRKEGGEVVVGVPNEFVRTWVKDKYHKTILRLLREHDESIRSVEYAVSTPKVRDKALEQTSILTRKDELPLAEHYIDKRNNLNPRYTFETFIVGPFNELAYAAAQAIVKNPGLAYNPLFVYGQTGHGKTHLIQAIGNSIKQRFSSFNVYYITCEKFTVDYVNAVQGNKVNAFKEKYRKYDVLIMDDIQFLSKKEKTQEELFHLFNTLYDNNKQIIFSSDMHPSYLQGMEERLKSRFGAGMIVDIPQPDQESRIAILKAKIAQTGIALAPDVIDYLASSISSNIRELEGALNTIVCHSELKGRETTINDVKQLIRSNVRSKKTVPVKDIVRLITNFYNIEEESIYKKTRKKEVVKPRQVIMYILREDYQIPYPSIGHKIGGRDHTTVIHSYEKIKRDLKTDSALAQEIQEIRSML